MNARVMTVEEIRLLTEHIVEQNALISDLRDDLFDAEQEYETLARDYDRLNDDFREMAEYDDWYDSDNEVEVED